MYDIVIIGAGTAGMSAAIYARRAGKSALIIEGKTYGGQIINTPDIENYPGIAHVSGFEFATGLYNQAKELGAEIKMAEVKSVEDKGNIKEVHVVDEVIEAKAVIIATGAKNRELGLDNESELVGRGVSYCATCDGMFFRGKDVAVNGGGNTALEDAAFLSNYCNKVYIVHRRDEFRGDEREVDKLKEKENVEFVLSANVTKIISDDMVKGIEVTYKETGEKREIPVSGLFVAIGQVPDNKSFENIVDLDYNGYVVAGEDCLTKTPGIFAAGDCRTKQVRQLTTAAADGAVAALAAAKYIDGLE